MLGAGTNTNKRAMCVPAGRKRQIKAGTHKASTSSRSWYALEYPSTPAETEPASESTAANVNALVLVANILNCNNGNASTGCCSEHETSSSSSSSKQ